MSLFKKVAGAVSEAAARGTASRAHAAERYERQHRSELTEEQSEHLHDVARKNKELSEYFRGKADQYKE